MEAPETKSAHAATSAPAEWAVRPEEAVRARTARPHSRAADAFVMLAMTLTTAALTIGLYLQLKLAPWLAALVAGSVFAVMLSLHALVRRSERIAMLSAEVARLQAELEGGAAGRMPSSAPVAAPGRPVPAALSPHAQKGAAAATRQPTLRQPAPAQAAAKPPAGAGTREAGAKPAAAQSAEPLSAAVSGQSTTQSAEGMSPPPAARKDAPLVPASAVQKQGTPPVDAALQTPLPERAVDAIMNDYWAYRPMQPPRLSEAGQIEGGAAPDVGVDRAALQRELPGAPPADQPLLTSSSPREEDVEMIQGLIKKLADQVNAAEAGLSLESPSARVSPAAIEASVNALRTTADQMRGQAAQPAVPRRRVHDGAGRTGEAAADAMPLPRSEIVVPQRSARAEAMPPPLPPVFADMPSEAGATRAALAPWPEEMGRKDVGPGDIGPEEMGPEESAASALSARIAGEPGLAGQAPVAVPAESSAEMDDPRAAAEHIAAMGAHSRLAACAEAITAGRLDVLLEPILGLADQRARHYEVSVRLRDRNGHVLEPPDKMPEINGSGLLPLLDCARVQKSAQIAGRLADRGKPGSVFSGFSGESLSHDRFLSEFIDAYATREALSSQLVLSFPQIDVRIFSPRDWETIEEMRGLGFRFALHSVTDLDLDFEALKAAGFDFVKLDASVFLEGMPASGGVIPSADICRHLARLGMTLVVGGIEDDAQLARIFGFGVIYGQGQLFGGPRSIKPEVLAGGRQGQENAAA